MKDSGNPSDDENRSIPAGYTYLGQLVAHDLIHNVLPFSGTALRGRRPVQDDMDLVRDYRTNRLVLDTIYGGGPSTDPLVYGVEASPTRRSFKLRLGEVRVKREGSDEHVPGAFLDIARTRCPHLNDNPGARGAVDALLADPRNDDNLILSQLTVLFHRLHNYVFERVRGGLCVAGEAAEELAFFEARKIVAYVYRRIIRSDLMPRLIEDSVYRYYFDPKREFPRDWSDKEHDCSNRVPVEFSHAAYRFGHVLIRFTYTLNRELDPAQPLAEVLDRSSARKPYLVPVRSDWVVDWRHFFDLGDGTKLNLARKIRPYSGHGVLAGDEGGEFNGGLFYADLVRSAEAGLKSVASLVREMPAQFQQDYPLKDAEARAAAIRQWLEGGDFSEEELQSLTQDPPLAFFVLFEAEATQAGKKLGALGSVIVGEVISAALKHGENAIEKDISDETLDALFGAEVPDSMPALIRFVHAGRTGT